MEPEKLWIKRDDLTGPAGGGNKARKLQTLVDDAIAKVPALEEISHWAEEHLRADRVA